MFSSVANLMRNIALEGYYLSYRADNLVCLGLGLSVFLSSPRKVNDIINQTNQSQILALSTAVVAVAVLTNLVGFNRITPLINNLALVFFGFLAPKMLVGVRDQPASLLANKEEKKEEAKRSTLQERLGSMEFVKSTTVTGLGRMQYSIYKSGSSVLADSDSDSIYTIYVMDNEGIVMELETSIEGSQIRDFEKDMITKLRDLNFEPAYDDQKQCENRTLR